MQQAVSCNSCAFLQRGQNLKTLSARQSWAFPGNCKRFQQVPRSGLRVDALKKDIHPKYYEESPVFCNGEEVLVVSGTKPKYTVDVWSGNHPFFQGGGNALVVDEGRVTRFNRRFAGLEGTLGAVAPAGGSGEKLKMTSKYGKDKGKKGKGKR